MMIDTSRPIAEVARDLGMNEGTLGNWVSVHRKELAYKTPAEAAGQTAKQPSKPPDTSMPLSGIRESAQTRNHRWIQAEHRGRKRAKRGNRKGDETGHGGQRRQVPSPFVSKNPRVTADASPVRSRNRAEDREPSGAFSPVGTNANVSPSQGSRSKR